MNTKDGKIVLPDGMSYEILVLPDQEDSNPRVLEKLMQLVRNGATIVGPKPIRSNGLSNYPRSDSLVRNLADQLWGPCNGKDITENSFGKGKVIWGKKLFEILAERGIGPDFAFRGRNDSADLDYIHRSTGDEEIYFSATRTCKLPAECEFRIKNRIPNYGILKLGKPYLIRFSSGKELPAFLQLLPAVQFSRFQRTF
jgi:hypothetical protein